MHTIITINTVLQLTISEVLPDCWRRGKYISPVLLLPVESTGSLNFFMLALSVISCGAHSLMSSCEDEEEVVGLTVDRHHSYGSGGDADAGANSAICSFASCAIPGNGMEKKSLNELYRLTSCKNFLKESLGTQPRHGALPSKEQMISQGI